MVNEILLPIYFLSAALIAIGLYGVMSRTNIIKMLLSLSLMEVGVNIFLVAMGYLPGGTAPILNSDGPYVDPIPQALVLTAIVIGVSVTALGLAVAIGYYNRRGTLDLSGRGVMKW